MTDLTEQSLLDAIASMRAKKPRAKRGTGTYGTRNADERRKYFREYMRKRRAKAKTDAV